MTRCKARKSINDIDGFIKRYLKLIPGSKALPNLFSILEEEGDFNLTKKIIRFLTYIEDRKYKYWDKLPDIQTKSFYIEGFATNIRETAKRVIMSIKYNHKPQKVRIIETHLNSVVEGFLAVQVFRNLYCESMENKKMS